MNKSENAEKEFKEINKSFMDRTGPGSKTAEGMAVHRFLESQKPDGERICYDPYAVYFISPAMMKSLKDSAKNPEDTKKKAEMYERFFSGLFNSIHARVRYFDDFVKRSIDEELEQLVILVHRFQINSLFLDHNSARHFFPFFNFIFPFKNDWFFVNLVYILTNSFL